MAFALIYAVACIGAPAYTHHLTPLPTVIRADTRDFIGFRYQNEEDIAITINIITAALPNETSMCLYGFAKDTIIHMVDSIAGDSTAYIRKIAVIDSVAIANIDSAGPKFVQYIDRIACDYNRRLIGKAHTHPLTPPYFMGGQCDHSHPDAIYTHDKGTKYWFVLVMCPTSNNIMWADGRRIEFGFKNPFP